MRSHVAATASAALVLGLCTPAAAQAQRHATPGDDTGQATSAPGSAPASKPNRPGPDNGTDALLDITVTARRRVEDAQKVPESLSVVSRTLLDRSYTVNTSQLSLLLPALNYSSANPRNTAFTIRGLGSSVVAVSQANDGLEPGVGFYVDQVYHARPATAAFDFQRHRAGRGAARSAGYLVRHNVRVAPTLKSAARQYPQLAGSR